MSDETDIGTPITAPSIIGCLNEALNDLKETQDYLSYATLLDVHLSNPERFTDNDKKAILNALHDILSQNLDIVEQIGWDLPELLLPFFNLEWDFQGSLNTTGIINLIMSIFDTVAKNGNAKELFIKSIEILSSIPFLTEEEGQSDEVSKLGIILDVKIHTIIELLSSSLKRINTLYPSKFLAMALNSLLQLYIRYSNYSSHTIVVLRRLYSFARDYLPPLKPLNWIQENDLTQEESQKLIDDENYLQRVLFQSYLTNIYALSFNTSSLCYAFHYYKDLQLIKKGLLPMKHELPRKGSSSTAVVFSRLFALATSFDIEFVEEFEKLKKDSVELFQKTIKSEQSDDDKIQDAFKLSINDRIVNLLNSDSKTIPKSPQGLLIMTTQYQNETEDDLSLTLHELISISIRFLSPGLLSDKFRNFGVLDAMLYWSWSTIIKATPKDFQAIPKFQIITFLQIIIFYCSVIPDPSVGLVSYTLLTRILTLIHEEISYSFIIDTLTTAPFQNSKAAIITILKDLIIRECIPCNTTTSSSSVPDISDALKQVNLSDKPPLPKRHYIQLNQSRVEDIYALIRETIDETLSQGVTESKVLLGYLNLLIGIRKLYPTDKIQDIVNIVKEKLSGLNDDKSKDFINIAVESLESHLSEEI